MADARLRRHVAGRDGAKCRTGITHA